MEEEGDASGVLGSSPREGAGDDEKVPPASGGDGAGQRQEGLEGSGAQHAEAEAGPGDGGGGGHGGSRGGGPSTPVRFVRRPLLENEEAALSAEYRVGPDGALVLVGYALRRLTVDDDSREKMKKREAQPSSSSVAAASPAAPSLPSEGERHLVKRTIRRRRTAVQDGVDHVASLLLVLFFIIMYSICDLGWLAKDEKTHSSAKRTLFLLLVAHAFVFWMKQEEEPHRADGSGAQPTELKITQVRRVVKRLSPEQLNSVMKKKRGRAKRSVAASDSAEESDKKPVKRRVGRPPKNTSVRRKLPVQVLRC